MKVLLPTNITHTVKLIPRFEPTETLSLEVKKEGFKTVNIQEPIYVLNNGVLSLTFDLTGSKQDRFLCKLSQNNEVLRIFRVFFTDQTPQNFKLTKDSYKYVE